MTQHRASEGVVILLDTSLAFVWTPVEGEETGLRLRTMGVALTNSTSAEKISLQISTPQRYRWFSATSAFA